MLTEDDLTVTAARTVSESFDMYPSCWILSDVMNCDQPQSMALGHNLNVLSGFRLA